MKNLRLTTVMFASTLALLATTPAQAASSDGPKGRLFAKYDTNKNGVIDGDEIAALRKDFAAEPKGPLGRYDTDKDGKLSDEEIAQIKPPGHNRKAGEKKGGKKAQADSNAEDKAKSETPAPSQTPPEKPEQK